MSLAIWSDFHHPGKSEVVDLTGPVYARGNGCMAGEVIGYKQITTIKSNISGQEARNIVYGSNPLEWWLLVNKKSYGSDITITNLVWVKAQKDPLYESVLKKIGKVYNIEEIQYWWKCAKELHPGSCFEHWVKEFVENFEDEDRWNIPNELREEVLEMIKHFK